MEYKCKGTILLFSLFLVSSLNLSHLPFNSFSLLQKSTSFSQQDKALTGNQAKQNLNTQPPNDSDAANQEIRTGLESFRKSNSNYADMFIAVKDIKCNDINCPAPGHCYDSSTCICGIGRSNFPIEGINGIFCQYRQKKQLIAFLFEFFLSCGIGHFYAGRTSFGIVKLLITLGPAILFCMSIFGILMIEKFLNGTVSSICLLVLICVFSCAASIWWVLDVILFGMNSYRDGNGVPLEHW